MASPTDPKPTKADRLYRLTFYSISLILSACNLTVYILQLIPEIKWPEQVIKVVPILGSVLWTSLPIIVPMIYKKGFSKDKYFGPFMVLQFIVGAWLSLVYTFPEEDRSRADILVDTIPSFVLAYVIFGLMYTIYLSMFGILKDDETDRYLVWVWTPMILCLAGVLLLGIFWLFGCGLQDMSSYDRQRDAVTTGRGQQVAVAPSDVENQNQNKSGNGNEVQAQVPRERYTHLGNAGETEPLINRNADVDIEMRVIDNDPGHSSQNLENGGRVGT
ncbi:hypothetical protein VKT23_001728 [Stygiomarasmius scandens]|uniref:Uncharacterized protein n=1 Tax=Marasmiellus scandens TaxID=2682957 RepID=A0ABR1K3X2_9AGAR